MASPPPSTLALHTGITQARVTTIRFSAEERPFSIPDEVRLLHQLFTTFLQSQRHPDFTNQKTEVQRRNMKSESVEVYHEKSQITGCSEKPAELHVFLL